MVEATLLVAAVAVGAAAQGGYYPAGRIAVLALVLLAALLRGRTVAPADTSAGPTRLSRWLLPAACAPLALWALGRGWAAGATREGLAAAGTVASLALAAMLVSRADRRVRQRCADALCLVGTAVAVTAWAGVAWRYGPFVQLVEHRLWRGSSTITYPNATAALLAPLALLAIGLTGRRPAPARAAMGYLLLVGLAATLSRAGFLALAIGLLVLAAAGGVRAIAVRVAPPLLGAGVSLAALAPSVPAASAPHPATAVAGLLAGLLLATAPDLLTVLPAKPARRALGLATAGVLAAGVVGVLAVLRGTELRPILASRGTLASSGRTGAWHAAWVLVGEHPWVGTGIGLARFLWPDGTGNVQVARYAHDEYLQLLVDLGAIGAVALLGLLAALAVTAWRGRPAARRPGLWAGALAAATALAVHSGFDFLWHLAVLPLLGGLLIGLASAVPSEEQIGTAPAGVARSDHPGPEPLRPELQKENAP
jgi:O-Antigen ligase